MSAGVFAVAARDISAHTGMGPVTPPLLVPNTWVIDEGGQERRMLDVLSGKVSAVQTMFTGCSSVCPLQGALFSAVQEGMPQLRSRRSLQLISVSIDPLADSPDALHTWLKRFVAGPSWHAVAPRLGDVKEIRAALAGQALSPNLDSHSTQVYFFDKTARLCWRSTSFPLADEVLYVLEHLAEA